jgi:electron transfer flavoprotein beta subunit
VAEILGIPQIMYGVAADIWANGKKIRVKRETEDGYEVVEMRLPGVVSVSKGSLIRRLPSFKDILDARSKPFSVLCAADTGLAEEDLGLMGSPTQVVRIFPPRSRLGGRMVDGSDPDVAVGEIVAFLKARKFI